MKNILLSLSLAVIGLQSTSCVYNNPTADDGSCDHYLNGRTLDGNDAAVNDIALYIYNPAGVLVGYYPTTINTPINIEKYRSLGSCTAVQWGNALGNKYQLLVAPTLGSAIKNNTLMFMPSGETYASIPLTNAPYDIHQGSQQVNFSDTKAAFSAELNSITTVYLERVVSSFILTVENLNKIFTDPNNDYEILIHHPYNSLDSKGTPMGNKSTYRPKSVYNPTTGQLTTLINMALPTGDNSLVIEIYSGGKLVYTATVDNNGKMISLERNKLSNILIKLPLNGPETGDITLIISNWSEVLIFQDF